MASLLNKSEYGFCRGLASHRWKLVSLAPDVSTERGKRLVVKLGCDNCGAIRADTVGQTTGMVLDRVYSYPQGYLVKLESGEEKGTRKQRARAEYIKHLMSKNGKVS